MKRSLSVTLFIALLLALLPLLAVFAQEDAEAIYKLVIRNLTDQSVSLLLVAQDGPGSIGLSVGPGDERVFTVRRGLIHNSPYPAARPPLARWTFSNRFACF
jgi:hypothetical protein